MERNKRRPQWEAIIGAGALLLTIIGMWSNITTIFDARLRKVETTLTAVIQKVDDLSPRSKIVIDP